MEFSHRLRKKCLAKNCNNPLQNYNVLITATYPRITHISNIKKIRENPRDAVAY